MLYVTAEGNPGHQRRYTCTLSVSSDYSCNQVITGYDLSTDGWVTGIVIEVKTTPIFYVGFTAFMTCVCNACQGDHLLWSVAVLVP
jgi:hypothetical protein